MLKELNKKIAALTCVRDVVTLSPGIPYPDHVEGFDEMIASLANAVVFADNNDSVEALNVIAEILVAKADYKECDDFVRILASDGFYAPVVFSVSESIKSDDVMVKLLTEWVIREDGERKISSMKNIPEEITEILGGILNSVAEANIEDQIRSAVSEGSPIQKAVYDIATHNDKMAENKPISGRSVLYLYTIALISKSLFGEEATLKALSYGRHPDEECDHNCDSCDKRHEHGEADDEV